MEQSPFSSHEIDLEDYQMDPEFFEALKNVTMPITGDYLKRLEKLVLG